jgi:xanthine dehydrogenase FAD-binding subunit
MRDFEYEAPTTLAHALELMSSGPAARPLAGGTDLIDHVRTGRLAPDLVVDVKKLPELNIFEFSSEGLRLGAAVPCYKLYGDERIRKSYSALSDAAHIIGGMQIQSRASVGGNVCTSGPAADSIPALIALSAVVVIAGPGGGGRELPIEQFCTGPGQNVLQAGEIVVEFRIPAPPMTSGSHYRRFIPRNEMDIAVVGVGAAVTLDDSRNTITAARIGLGAVAPTPLFADEASRLLVGRSADGDFREAAAAAVGIISPITDMRGTQEFRRHVTGVLVERVVGEAVKRARGH